jgi:hypothetical protein
VPEAVHPNVLVFVVRLQQALRWWQPDSYPFHQPDANRNACLRPHPCHSSLQHSRLYASADTRSDRVPDSFAHTSANRVPDPCSDAFADRGADTGTIVRSDRIPNHTSADHRQANVQPDAHTHRGSDPSANRSTDGDPVAFADARAD